MKRRLVAASIGILMVGTMSTAAIAIASADDDSGKTKVERADKDAKGEHGQHRGRPDWAQGGKADKGDKGPDAAWKDAWRKLTPAQRAAKMAELAQQHADGMKKWAACVKTAGEDAGARGKCTRPLPPGLAKKRLAPTS
jgi:hypothetical protein